MTYNLRAATPDDVPALCSIYFSAFSDTIIGRQVFPASSPKAQQFWRESLSQEITEPHANFLLVTSPSSDEPIAFAKWVSPGAEIENPPPADAWPKDANVALAETFFSSLIAAHRKFMGQEPHWYLELIAVKREWMGKGAASGLMRWGMEKADAEGRVSFLEASENGLGMYEKYGFRVVGEDRFESPEGEVVEYYMIRDKK